MFNRVIRFSCPKKNLFYKLLIITICSFLLAGCTINPFDTKDESNILSEGSSQIIWWGLFEDEENIQPLIDVYESENPDVEIVYTKKTKDNYLSEINTVLQDGNPNTTPDIFMIHNTTVGNYSEFISNAPASVISIDDYRSDFHDFVSEDFGYGAQVRGLPLWVDLLGVVYHRNLLLDTGDTVISYDWSSFLRQAENMTTLDEEEQIERGGFSAGTSSNVEFYFEVLNLLLLQARDTELTEEARAVPFMEEERDQIDEALVFYRSFEDKTWNDQFKLDTAAFIEGDLSSIIVPTWRILDILAFNEERNLQLDLGVSQVPQLNPETSMQVNFPTYWGFVVSKDSTQKTQAWELLKFLGEKDTQELYMQTQIDNGRPFAMISSRNDLVSNQTDNEYLAPYIESIPYTHSWYMINGHKLKEVYAGVIDGGTTLDDLLEVFEDIKDNQNVL
ncbi:extracellular solute-binding protein [Candidatus Dojkabacteria bacterium]|nr:extracellular solute-binding protein [Candidatus Dojkabacteria bacterium]